MSAAAEALSNSGNYGDNPVVAETNSALEALSDATVLEASPLLLYVEKVGMFLVEDRSILSLDYSNHTDFGFVWMLTG